MTPSQQFIISMTKVLAPYVVPFIFGGLLGWHAPSPRYMTKWRANKKSAKQQLCESLTVPKPRNPQP